MDPSERVAFYEAELANATRAAEESLEGKIERRCLKCGGELKVVSFVSAYQVVCAAENRVIYTARGI